MHLCKLVVFTVRRLQLEESVGASSTREASVPIPRLSWTSNMTISSSRSFVKVMNTQYSDFDIVMFKPFHGIGGCWGKRDGHSQGPMQHFENFRDHVGVEWEIY